MRLNRLVLNGFKSFADKTVFEFEKDFTAIVGPNGSGKSNVSDAIRWVLGEQSMKLLRGKQSADLIFNGSDKLGKLGMAQVELHLDNSDGTFPVEYSDIVIARKVFRNGESEFTMNKSKVRLQDIVMMLAKAQFGQKSYAVIGQGMITGFLSSTPQERKIFFDEATGVREFQIKRDQAINKLIRSEENVEQSEALLAEITPHLQSLERMVKRLEKREKLEEELKEVQLHYYGAQWKALEEKHTALQEQHKGYTAEIATLEAQLEEHQAKSDEVAAEESRGERYEKLQLQLNGFTEQKNALLKEQVVLRGRLEVEHERRGKLSLVWLQRKEDEVQAELQKLEAEQNVLRQQMEREEHELKRQEKRLESVRGEFRDEEYGIVELKEQIEKESHAFSIPEVQERLQVIFADHEAFLEQLLATSTMDQFKEVQKQARTMSKKFANFMDELCSDEREVVEALRVEMKQKEQALQRLILERDAVQKGVNELKVSIDSAKNKAQFTDSQVAKLKKELEDVRGQISEQEQEDTAEQKEAQVAAINQQLTQFEGQIADIEKQSESVRKEISEFNEAEEEKKTRLVAIQGEMRKLQRQITNNQQQANTVEVNLARIETKQEDMRNEIVREVVEELHKQIFDYSQGEGNSTQALEKRMLSIQRQLASIGTIDDATVQEYNETKERYDFLTEQLGDLDQTIEQLEEVIDELDKTIKTQFERNFKAINDGFQDYFKVLFNGGKAALKMLVEEDTDDEEEDEETVESVEDQKKREFIGKKKKKQKVVSGIDVIAHPPGKKVSNINALSGGEKSMVAIALLCSIIAHNPSPFVFLDEVEAALDEENSEKLAAIIKELSNKTQIIVITHNRVTMRAADVLYGVTMGTEGKSHILSVELTEAEEMAEA